MAIGTRLDLVPDPKNQYSEDAVAVVHEGHHLGYIPERHNWIASALRGGHQLSCYVRKIEIVGWIFRRASFVGLEVRVEDGRDAASGSSPTTIGDTKQTALHKTARQTCLDGLRVLAFLSMADNDVTAEELKIQRSYIESRLAMVGVGGEGVVDAMLALSQGLSVTKWSLTRAVNRIALDRKHYALVLNAALQLAVPSADPRGTRFEALQRLKKAGKARGWI